MSTIYVARAVRCCAMGPGPSFLPLPVPTGNPHPSSLPLLSVCSALPGIPLSAFCALPHFPHRCLQWGRWAPFKDSTQTLAHISGSSPDAEGCEGSLQQEARPRSNGRPSRVTCPPHPYPHRPLAKKGQDQWHLKPPAHGVQGYEAEEGIGHPAPAQILRK